MSVIAANPIADWWLQDIADKVAEFVGTVAGSIGAGWLAIGTPNLIGDANGTSATSAVQAPNAANVAELLGAVQVISVVLVLVGVMVVGARMAVAHHRGHGLLEVGKLGYIAAAGLLVGAAGLVGSYALPGMSGGAGTVPFVRDALWWWTAAAVVFSVLFAAGRTAFTLRKEPLIDLFRSLLTLLVVAAASLWGIQLAVQAADGFSIWFIELTAGREGGFGSNLMALMGGLTSPTGGVGALGVVVVGIIAALAGIVQIGFMLLRSAMIVLLTATLPTSAAFTNTDMGKSWFKKNLGWLIAFILYKPIAALVYGIAFLMVGADWTQGWDQLMTMMLGVLMLGLALVALPALMKFMVPAVLPLMGGGGAGAGVALAAAAGSVGGELASHAIRSSSSKSQQSVSSSSSSEQITTGSGSGPAPSVSRTGAAPSTSSPSTSAGEGSAAASSSGKTAATGSGSGTAAASTGTGAAAGSGAAAAGSGAAAAGSAGAAAAGPAAPAVIAAQKAAELGLAAKNAAAQAAEGSTGEQS